MKLTKTWHKIIAVALAVVLLLSVIPLAQLVVAASTKTVYFRNDWLWTNVKIHYWGGSSGTTYPGIAMKKVDTHNGYDVYSAEIPADTTGMLFNGTKNEGGGEDKSPDITDIRTNGCYYMHWDNGNKVLLDTRYTPPTDETDPPATTAPSTNPPDPDDTDLNVEAGYIYFEPSSDWTASSAVFVAYFYGGGYPTWVDTEATNVSGVVKVKVPSGYSNVIFVRMNPDNIDYDDSNNWNKDHKWQQTSNQTIDGNYFKLNSGTQDNVGGTWSTVGSGSGSGSGTINPTEPKDPVVLEDYMVDTDIVDYLNDNRVSAGKVFGHSTDNQGTVNENINSATFSYFNYLISLQAESSSEGTAVYLKPSSNWKEANASFAVHYWGSSEAWVTMTEVESGIYKAIIPSGINDFQFVRRNSTGTENWNYSNDYTVSANGGKLCTLSSGYDKPSATWSSYTDPSSDSSDTTTEKSYTYPLYFGNLLYEYTRYGKPWSGNTSSLNKWNTGANVALSGSDNAVVQGLVGDKLDKFGQLLDPVTGEQLIYFNKEIIENWAASGNDSKKVAAYYENLDFPFNAVYDPNTKVTTYSFDSEDDVAFIDYANYSESNKRNPMIAEGSHAKDYNGHNGFFPLNEPNESGTATNYGFGAKLTIEFTVNDEGVIVAADGTETPVTFSFTGDDDVWVFVDGYLVLDMGGAHKKASGYIDFKDLSATVAKAATVSTTYINPSNSGSGEQRENLTIENNRKTSFPEELKAAFEAEYANNTSEVHTLTMFYMERGTVESNMSIEFTISPIPSGLTVSKDFNESEINSGIIDEINAKEEFDFEFSATNTEDVSFKEYSLIDSNGAATIIDLNGNKTSVTLEGIRNDRYAANFLNSNGMSAFHANTEFTITEKESSIFQYSSTIWKVYDLDSGKEKATIMPIVDGEGKTATFFMGSDENKSYNYNVNFINEMKLGSLTLSKKYVDKDLYGNDMSGGAWEDEEFVFTLWLDLDGDGTNFFPMPYSDVDYTVDGEPFKTNANGQLTLKANQTAVIGGIPVGATYEIVETVDSNAFWVQHEAINATGTITEDGSNAEIVFKNKTGAIVGGDKVIYVATNTDTPYTLKFDGVNTLTDLVVSEADGITTGESNGVVTVNATLPGQTHVLSYSGHNAKGKIVSGNLTVYTYEAEDHVYVFDFGLRANLADTTYDNGLFQNGTYTIPNDGASSYLSDLSANPGVTQTLLSAPMYPTNSTIAEISDKGEFAMGVTFTPKAFMSKVETWNYTVTVRSDNWQSVNPDNPESGCVISGTITVLPANTVYYEDGFSGFNPNATNDPSADIIYNGQGVTVTTDIETRYQSNDQNANYGYDDVYAEDLNSSCNAELTMTHGETAFFNFTGTGFDIISRTNSTSAGFAVYVVSGSDWNATTLEAQVTAKKNGQANSIVKAVFVDNYYSNGDLSQIPVVTVENLAYGNYTVYIKALQTTTGVNEVALDAIRIYNPLGTNTEYYLDTEKGATVLELRDMYINGKLDLAVNSNGNTVTGDAQTIVENYNGGSYTYADETAVETVIESGPNNELYLPKTQGVHFSYKVTDTNWTLQVGMKAVGSAKKVGVYVDGTKVMSIDNLGTATDMYYDLTKALSDMGFNESGEEYDIVILNETTSNDTYEFVSLTTVKYSGVEIVNP